MDDNTLFIIIKMAQALVAIAPYLSAQIEAENEVCPVTGKKAQKPSPEYCIARKKVIDAAYYYKLNQSGK